MPVMYKDVLGEQNTVPLGSRLHRNHAIQLPEEDSLYIFFTCGMFCKHKDTHTQKISVLSVNQLDLGELT